jgi:hypothetical protein
LIRIAASGRGSTVAWCAPLRRQTWRLEVVWRSLPRNMPALPQYERFRAFAREHGADDDLEAFDRKFRKIVPPKTAP